MRYLLLLAIITTPLLSYAQVTDNEHFGCHHIKQKIASVPLTEEQQLRAKAALERSDTFDVLHYDISLDLTQFENAYLLAETQVDFSAKMDSIQYLNLDLEGLQVNFVVNADGDTLNYRHEGPLLKIFLDTLLMETEEYSVIVNYEGNPITCPSGFGGFYFEDGYAYNLGIGLAASPHNFGRAWFPCFDNFVERSTYTYNVRSHDGRRAYAVGTFISEDSIGGDTVVRRYSMMQPIPTYLSHVAVAKYSEVRYMHQGKYGAVPISLVAKTPDTNDVRKSFEPLGETIDCLEEWYGPYPFERVGYNITSRGAMEHPTAVAYPDNSIENGITNLGLITHELCHHWWGDITTLKTEYDMWLKEGPASYSEHQIIECMQGPEAFEDAVRTNNVAMINSAHLADDGFHPLSPMPDEWTYGRTTYDKGAAMIHNLRAYLGDSLFKVGMQSVLSELAYQSISAAEFRDQLISSTDYDLTYFFDNWIFSPGWSDFYVDHFQVNDGQDSILISINQGVYGTSDLHEQVPLQIGLYHPEKGLHKLSILCSGENTVKSVAVPFIPQFVFANPDQHLNLASAGDLYLLDENGDQRIDFSSWRVSTNELMEPYPLQLTHHWIAPEDDLPDSIPFRLSSTHFWTVNAPEISGELSGRINYYGGTGSEIDYDLAQNTEDSLILVYRPDGNSNWLEYPYYTKRQLFPGDGRGFLELDKVISGQYAFANGPSGTFVDSEDGVKVISDLYPNPSTDFIRIEWDPSEWDDLSEFKIRDINGKLVTSGPINEALSGFSDLSVHSLNTGFYFLELHNPEGLVSMRQFIKL